MGALTHLQSLRDLVALKLVDPRRERSDEENRAHRPDCPHRYRDVGELRRRSDQLLADREGELADAERLDASHVATEDVLERDDVEQAEGECAARGDAEGDA